MYAYTFAPDTGEYIGRENADPSPLEPGVWLIPGGATEVEPPVAVAGKARTWNGSAWVQTPDHRGETWFGGADERTPIVVTWLGNPSDRGLRATPKPETPQETKARLVAHAALRRRLVEEGGTTAGGSRFETDRTTQSMLTGAVLSAQYPNGPQSFQWKTADGFMTLTVVEIRAIATAVALHVQASFATEAVVVAAIEAGTITTETQIDAAGWPS